MNGKMRLLHELYEYPDLMFDGSFDEFVAYMDRNEIRYEDVHPLKTYVSPDADPWAVDEAETHSQIISIKIRELMEDKGITAADLAAKLPNAKGEIGISPSYAARIVKEPGLASVAQVDAMCALFGCTLDYLRNLVDDYRSRTVDYGAPYDMALVYQRLNENDKRAVWNHAVSLLELHEGERYDYWGMAH